jgi:hypothetical protein
LIDSLKGMIEQNHIRSILIFFRLSLADEQVAKKLANTACNKLLNSFNKSSDLNIELEMISICQKLLGKTSFNQKLNTRFSFGDDWLGATDLDSESWSVFAATTSLEIVSTVIWCLILEIDYEVVAKALKVSEGTIRLRLSLAVRKMGAIVSKNSARTLAPV